MKLKTQIMEIPLSIVKQVLDEAKYWILYFGHPMEQQDYPREMVDDLPYQFHIRFTEIHEDHSEFLFLYHGEEYGYLDKDLLSDREILMFRELDCYKKITPFTIERP